MSARTHLFVSAAIGLMACSGCSDDPSSTDTTSDTSTTTDAAPPDGVADTGDTGDIGLDDADARDVVIDAWPWPSEAITIAADPSWKGDLTFPSDAFRAYPTVYDPPQPRWVKFVVFTGDPTHVYFQDSVAYPFHFPFASAHLPPLAGLSASQFDDATLHFAPSQRAILGAVLFAPERVFNGAAQLREVGVQLVGQDPLPFVVAETVLALVHDHLSVDDQGAPPAFFYLPTFEQRATAEADATRFAAAGFPVSSADRWQYGDSCYTEGWAVGRLVQLTASAIPSAYASGALRFDDILLTDGVPAEVPFVAGIISTAAATPSSHVAILAATFGVPFVYLGDAVAQDEVRAMVGSTVALSAEGAFDAQALGACRVSVRDLGDRLSPAERAAILALKVPAPLQFPPKETLGQVSVDVSALTPKDIAHVGGKAANFGMLRRVLPDASPSPALALTFDLWDRVIGPLRPTIASTLAAHHWPPDVATLDSDLEAVREMVKDLDISSDDRAALRAALEGAGFDPLVKIRFRSSTNVEDQAAFTGAGLYDSYSGCLADDTDDDALGPSRCDASEPDERGVYRALKKVYASFWNDNAYLERLRHGVDEAQVGMAVLVHPSFPDASELANGVATLSGGGGQSSQIALVTQLGAVSVTNPVLVDGVSPQPEVLDGNVYDFGTYFEVRQHSSLVPLAGYVMGYDADYLALAGLLTSVGKAWGKDVSDGLPYLLDFEFKKVARPAPHLEVKQVRPLPIADTRRTQPAFLLPEAQPRLCTYQGEYGALFGNQRLKSQVVIGHVSGFADQVTLSASIYDHLRLERASGVDFDGAPATFPGAAHEAPTYDQYGNASALVDRWTRGSGHALETWELDTSGTWLVAKNESPLTVLDDLYLTLAVTYTSARPEPDQYPDGTTLSDAIRLGTCPDDVVLTPAYAHQHRSSTAKGVSVDITFYWPPAPSGVTAGYTAPLAKWDTTTISGLTTTPIVLRGYWSQTYKPGHHNFGEDFLFEPRLEDGLDPGLVAELNAADVAAIWVRTGGDDGQIQLVGLDGSLRPL